ncbi:MAG: GC-type dockerin domain-anchored protein [Planctomycetota bacterium]
MLARSARVALSVSIAPCALACAQDVYHLDARSDCFVPPARPVRVIDLPQGLYRTLPIDDVFQAWNPWGGSVSGCDAGGYGCSTGWATNHAVTTADGRGTGRFVARGEVAMTPALALLRPRIILFRKYAGVDLLIGIGDSLCSDNIGGVSVRVDPVDCVADLDLDGSLDLFDFLEFQTLFDAGNLVADLDFDGELTIFDFLAFQTAFDSGCP